jgi:hypothetical protein
MAALFLAIACNTTSWGRQAAQKPSVAVLLEKLHSTQEPERIKAFEQLHSNPASPQSPEVRAALLDLLDRENNGLDSQLLDAQKKGYPDEGDNEVWADYYSALIATVDSFADWSDPRQACILVDASSSDDSKFAREIADHAIITIPCLMKRSESAISMNRAVAVPVLVQALEKARGTLNPQIIEAAKKIVLDALRDPDDAVRGFTVHALAKFGTDDMITPLKKVAEADPSPEIEGHSIRKDAGEAISAIEERARGKREL